MIKITTKSDELPIDLKKVIEDISAETGIACEHLMMFIEALPPAHFYKGAGNLYPIVHVSSISRNGQEKIQILMKAAAKAVASQVNLDAANITVYAHPIEPGYLLMGENFV
jgi:hypothetical protein